MLLLKAVAVMKALWAHMKGQLGELSVSRTWVSGGELFQGRLVLAHLCLQGPGYSHSAVILSLLAFILGVEPLRLQGKP